jgi:hypothetical protein
MFEEHRVRIMSGVLLGKFEVCEGERLELLEFLSEWELGELWLLFELEEC